MITQSTYINIYISTWLITRGNGNSQSVGLAVLILLALGLLFTVAVKNFCCKTEPPWNSRINCTSAYANFTFGTDGKWE